MTKTYLLLTDKRGYGMAGETIALTTGQAEFLLLTGAIAEVQDTDTALPVEVSADTGSGDKGSTRARRVRSVDPGG